MLSLLTVLFIGLKLTGYIDWGWFYVVLPTVLHVGLVLSVLLLAVILKMLE